MDGGQENPDEQKTEFVDLTGEFSPDAETSLKDWNRYRIDSLLGEGGMGRVYKAFDPQLQRVVALKFIRGDDETLREGLLREARAQARIDHDNVCKIYEVGQVQGKSYIAMQFIDGLPLSQRFSDMILEQKVTVIEQIADALHAAHQIGIIHRDVKPANIMVEKKEDSSFRPYLMDFGIAREDEATMITLTRGIVGTPQYMSPEQILGHRHLLDRRTDIYSLGAAFYSILARRPPFEGSPSEIVMQVSRVDPTPLRKIDPGIPKDLETIVSKCLEKEPRHRYDSARALSEELRRYLQGEPIQARPVSSITRVIKKAKRNKTLTSVVVISLLAICFFAGFTFFTWNKAQREAVLAQRFGQEVTKIEGTLRTAYLWPLHDIDPEKQLVRERMKNIEGQIAGVGKVGFGPGHYALGRGHMALHEYESALKDFQMAWDAGYKQPEVAYGLGVSLGALYQKELGETRGVRDKKLRKTKVEELEKKYRDPALMYLQSGKSEASQYVEALIAFYERHWDEALKKSAVAEKSTSGSYDVVMLEGDVYRNMATEHAQNGRIRESKESFANAQDRFRRVVGIARSDPDGYRGLCQTNYDYVYMKLDSEGGDLIPDLKNSIEACEQGLQADTQNADLYYLLSRAFRTLSDQQMNEGVNPLESLNRAKEMAEKAIQFDPANARSHSALGAAYSSLAEYQGSKGLDNMYLLNLAIKNYQTAVKLNPGYEYAYLAIGNNYTDIGENAMKRGEDPMPYFRKAIESNETVIKIRPDYFAPYVNLGVTYGRMGELSMQTGKNPTEFLEKAVVFFQKSNQINPKSPAPFNNNCSIYITLGDFSMNHGMDPSEVLDKAIQNCEASIQINSGFQNSYINAAQANRLLYEYTRMMQGNERVEYKSTIQSFPDHADGFLTSELNHLDQVYRLNPTNIETLLEFGELYRESAIADLDKGISPFKNVEIALSYATKAQDAAPADNRGTLLKGRLEVIRARWLMKTGSSPDNDLQSARENLEKSLTLNPTDTLVYLSLAEYHRWKAESMLKQKHDPEPEILAGLQAIDKALAIKPDMAEAYAIRGVLNLRGSAFTQDLQEKEKAKQALQKAMEINKNLKRQYGSFLEQARAAT